jgi:hypothetical protein
MQARRTPDALMDSRMRGNTDTPIIMAAEKLADAIKRER